MASRLPHQEEDHPCPVCCHIIKHSVHSYCKDCLQEWWTENPPNGCAICKTRSSRDQPSGNLGLKKQCEKLKCRIASSESSEALCTVNGDKSLFFCLNDDRPDSGEKAGHPFRPVDEASWRCSRELQESLKPLKEKLDVFEDAKVKCDQAENLIKVQARDTEAQIKKQFKNLRQFLHDEEEARIATLREEEAQKSQQMKERIEGLSREMAALSDAIRAAEDQLRAGDHVSFLQDRKAAAKRVQLTQQDPQPAVSGGLLMIDEAKHLSNLAFSVWEKMREIVVDTPVTLDPNTAESGLVLSDDLTGVRRAELSENPERGVCCCNHWSSEERLDGKTVIITGANTGIGKETARDLARRGARIIMACRDLERAEEARKDILEDTGNQNMVVRKLDLSDTRSIRAFSELINREEKQVNMLINNAGIMMCPHSKTVDGFEMQLGVNHLGHFLLIYLLLDLIKRSAPSRIVVVSSVAHTWTRLHLDDINSEKSYDPIKAYGQSKLANVLCARSLAQRLQGSGVSVFSLHPGVVQSDLWRHQHQCIQIAVKIFRVFTKTTLEGAQTTIYCAVEPGLESCNGGYFSDCAPARCSRDASDDVLSQKLWEISCNMLGIKWD